MTNALTALFQLGILRDQTRAAEISARHPGGGLSDGRRIVVIDQGAMNDEPAVRGRSVRPLAALTLLKIIEHCRHRRPPRHPQTRADSR
jgi:hypothetical protein